MKLRLLAPAAAFVAALAAVPAQAGSLTVRDTDGGQWTVVEDPADDTEDYLLKHLQADRHPDPRFGRMGQTNFSLGADNDTPTTLRVDSTRRAWTAAATMSGNQPQPVVARFGLDGNLDVRWGVQGKVQLTPAGTPVRPNDVLPLADGSVLVAGETPGQGMPRAVVFHLKADGSLDTAFGSGGVWQRPGTEAATAGGLAAAPDGSIAVAVAVRGAKPAIEIWGLNEVPPTLVNRETPDDSVDEDDLRVEWATNHWAATTSGGPTAIVPPASLAARAAAPAPSAPADSTGQGGFNPFAAAPTASAAPAVARDADDGIPWVWIGIAVALAVGVLGLLFLRGGSTQAPVRQNARR